MEKFEYLLGIKRNGIAFTYEDLKLESDQSPYDYLCSIKSQLDQNGASILAIQFLDKNFNNGLPLNGWSIEDARIWYDWGKSKCYFRMRDTEGCITNEIFVTEGRGCASSSFNPKFMAKSIIPTALGIITRYPSSRVYNSISEFHEMVNDLSSARNFNPGNEPKTSIESFKKDYLSKINNLTKCYDEILNLLNSQEDVKSQNLLHDIQNEFHKTIESIFK